MDALGRIKEAVIAQQHALAEEQARALKREHYDDELASFSGEFKENGAFTAGDSKKRRGVSSFLNVYISQKLTISTEGGSSWKVP